MSTKIQWTDQTWNPVIGCRRVSEGCRNCYAETMAARLVSMGQERYRAVVDTGRRRWNGRAVTVPEKLGEPLRWRKPRLVFVNSMSDLFHEDVPFEYVAAVFGVMAACPEHTFQVLTKRPARMVAFFRWLGDGPSDTCSFHAERLLGRVDHRFMVWAVASHAPWPLPNVWLGVSVEDQATADERIPLLLECPAAVRWVSYEPALGAVSFREEWLRGRFMHCPDDSDEEDESACVGCPGWSGPGGDHCGAVRGPRLDWLVIGGESGPGARPFDVEWVRSVLRQVEGTDCRAFVKQLGAAPVVSGIPSGGINVETDRWPTPAPWVERDAGDLGFLPGPQLRDRKGGDMAEWPEDLRVREWPKAAAS